MRFMEQGEPNVSGPSGGGIPTCLQAEVCPNCGYSLVGLPDDAACPECGMVPDRSQIVLYGWARGSQENLTTAKKSRLAWVLVAPALWLGLQLFNFAFTRGPFPWFILIVALVVVMKAVEIRRRTNVDHPGMIQVRLNAKGSVQYNHLAGQALRLEFLWNFGWLITACGAVAIVFAYCRGSLEPIQFWIWFPLAIALSAGLAVRFLRYRRALSRVSDNAIADRNAAYVSPVPWKSVSIFSLGSSGDIATQHLRIGHLTWLHTEYHIDAEIRCTAEQAGQLKKWLNNCLEMARRGAG